MLAGRVTRVDAGGYRVIRKTPVIVTLLLLWLGVGIPEGAAGVIDIRIHNLTVGSWGPSSGQSYGQVITAPAGDAVLADYSFTVGASLQFPFVSQVYRWDGSRASGPSLFTSAIVLTPLPVFSQAVYVFSSNIPVTAGQQYIAFVTNQPDGSPLGGPSEAGGTMALNQDNLYEGGQFAFNTSGNPARGPWLLTLSNADAVLHATVVPEPATIVLFSLGLGALAGTIAWRWGPPRRPSHASRSKHPG